MMTNHKKTSVRPRSITLPGNGSSSSSGASSAADHTFTIDSGSNIKDIIGTIDIKSGTDTIISKTDFTLPTYIENLTLTGSATLGNGNSLDNIITGNNNGNILNGSTGKDILIGGTGNDTYYVDNIGDQVKEAITASNMSTQDIVVSSIDYTLSDTLENLTLNGNAKSGTGNNTSNIITGNAASNTLTGLDGNDTIDGGKGSDILIGGDGNDVYYVDNSRDIIQETTGSTAGTSDTIYSSVNYSLADNVENLVLQAGFSISGTGNTSANKITGNEKNNKLDGGKNSSSVGGGDTLIGGKGNDIYVVNNSNDLVDETTTTGGDGIDLVLSSVNYTLGENVENLTLTDSALIGTGNNLNNIIIGNKENNTLIGGSGSDKLYGGEGNDCLDGGDGTATADQGDDTLTGGLGSDIYYIRRTSQVIKETADKDSVDGVVTKINDYTLAANVENLTLDAEIIKGTGNSSNNSITGNTSDNILDGGKGADTLYGGLGNDTYIVDNSGDIIYDYTTSVTNAGTDLILSSISYTLGQFLENLTLTGNSKITGTGNGLSNTITGNSANNILDGGINTLGNKDTLVGGLGNDTYTVYALSDVIIIEGSDKNSGTDDTVITNAENYTLSADNVENLVLGKLNSTRFILNGTGNNIANTITGNDADNTLDGGKNTDATLGDTLIGGKGNDIYIANQTNDVIIEKAEDGEGTADLIQSSISYALGQNIENLTLTGTDNINGTGNTADNRITGNNFSNTLNGAKGNDTLIGGSGSDTLIGGQGDDMLYGGLTNTTTTDNSADVYVYSLNDGHDTIYEFESNTSDKILFGSNIKQADVAFDKSGTDLTFNIKDQAAVTVKDWFNGTSHYIEKAQFSDGSVWDLSKIQINETIGSSASTLTGWLGDDTLTGDTRANTLIGDSGNDTLIGGKGNDSLIGGAGNDTYLFDFSTNSAGDGVDIISETGGADSLILSNATSSQLWFHKSNNDLEITKIGDTPDKLVIKDWYPIPTTGTPIDYKIDAFKASDGKMLTINANVITLINNMAAYSAPQSISTSGSYYAAYNALAQSWTGP